MELTGQHDRLAFAKALWTCSAQSRDAWLWRWIIVNY